jgi:hypothetical protein
MMMNKPNLENIDMTGGSLTLSSHLILGQGNNSTVDFLVMGIGGQLMLRRRS